MSISRPASGIALRLDQPVATSAEIVLRREEKAYEVPAGHVLVRVEAAAVNPSDVKAGMGLMPYAVFPRTPGRDFAGTVVVGPASLVGRHVFGSSGDLGIRQDGSHASHVVVEARGLVDKPDRLSFAEAAGIGVPFVTGLEGLTGVGRILPGETLLVLGANGAVGQAACQIGRWMGCEVVGVVRRRDANVPSGVTQIDSSSEDVAKRVRELSGDRGADVVFNTVGEPYWQDGLDALAVGGRMILIASVKQPVSFDIFRFYRGRHRFVGVDTLALSSTDTAALLRKLVPGFTSGALSPLPVGGCYSLDEAARAYAAVAAGEPGRVILVMPQA